MKKSFIIYKITSSPSGKESIFYLKEIKEGKPVFTAFKLQARRVALPQAAYYTIRYRLSVVQEKLA